MKRIDRDTVQRILDAADIVEVVSDFVSLKKRGANYIGLCPFHNERTPSFSVSRAKGICKCFSCGKGGSAVNFVMEHEQMTFNEALRYLAKKYHIEIKEYEMTEAEQQEASEREAMLAVNDFALNFFRNNLTDTDDGRAIGLSYLRERGINDLMVERFRLGYSPESADALYKAATARGFDEKYLFETGLCARSERNGSVYDKFRGRVIYPLFSVSGRIVAFGGRTLRSDKTVSKYLNSPQSIIYNKSREVYGLYQAKSAIDKRGKCILVEGYMDVISMHQAGIDNVVASCGTSLTEGQIRLIHRFTDNVTLIYDADPAGVKASLRGIDLLLAEGMNVKVLLLPEGDDPDSFAQSHSTTEVEDYISRNETDFIRFKTDILLKDAHDDPIARAKVVNDILRSISVIPDTIVRAEYVKECSRMLHISEEILMLQLQRAIGEGAQRPQTIKQPQSPDDGQRSPADDGGQVDKAVDRQHQQSKMRKYEVEVLKYIVKYGMADLPVAEGVDPVSVIEYIGEELAADGINFTDDTVSRTYKAALEISQRLWPADYERHRTIVAEEFDEDMRRGMDDIRRHAVDLSDAEQRESELTASANAAYARKLDEYAVAYIKNALISSPDDEVRRLSTDLAFERYTLSKVHTRYAHVETERERLGELVPRAVLELKLGILNSRISEIYDEIKRHCNDTEVVSLLQEQKRLYEIRSEFSKMLGERIVTPKG